LVNKNYNRGRQFEYRVKKNLEDKGYLVVRSAGSKSPLDLVGISLGRMYPEVVLVQCKYGAKISKKERDKLSELNNKTPGCVYVFVAWAKPNEQIVYYEPSNGTILWDW